MGLSHQWKQVFRYAYSAILIGLLFLSFFFLMGCKENNYAKVPEEHPKTVLGDQEDKEKQIKRGEYLVTTIGCGDCHSPKQMSPRGPEIIPHLKLSGFQADQKLPNLDKTATNNGWVLMNADLTAAIGPWGISYAANLTSDPTGVGNWSYEQFKTAMQKGKSKGMENARNLLPPMPWRNFRNMADKDLKAIFAYLQSTDPVENIVPAPVPPEKVGEFQGK